MLKNNNQGIVRFIAKKNMKGNRTRNIIATLAIILTTFMFTTVFSIGFSLAENMGIMLVREQGGKATIFLEHPTSEQMEDAKKVSYMYAAGIRINADKIKMDSGSILTLDYYDQTEFEKNYLPAISDVKGSYPKKENEIMMSASALEELGIEEIKENMSITMHLSDGEQTFQLSGWFQDYESFSNGCHVFVSQAYVEKKGLTAEEDGMLSISADMGKQSKLLGELEEQVSLKTNQQFETTFDRQSESSGNNMAIAMVVGLVGALIILSGYLLINNIMYISVTKDIRFYGLLKAVGATSAQIRGIVRHQALQLSVLGIPIGIGLGALCSFVAVPTAIHMFDGGAYSSMPGDVRFHGVIYAGTIVFALITVLLSCKKPARKASSIAPVEAMKYYGMNIIHQNQKSFQKRRKRTVHGGKPYKMAWRNVFRDKKRAVLVFASLFMGIVTFLAVHVFFGCITLENYVTAYLPNDYNIHVSVDEERGGNPEDVDKLIEKFSNIKGITKIQLNRSVVGLLDWTSEVYKPFFDAAVQDVGQEYIEKLKNDYFIEADFYEAQIIGVDTEMIERYNKKAYQPVDIECFEKGEVCLIGRVDEKSANQIRGKKITIKDSISGQSIEIEIGSADTSGYGLSLGYYWQNVGAPEYIIVSQRVIDQLSKNPDIESIIMDCEKEAEGYVTAQIKKLVDNHPLVSASEIKSELMKEFQSSMNAMNILTGGISMVLILIGMLNFVNVMLTGVYSRRRELAMLESVGMTKKQSCRMLICEGVYYAMITVVLIVTLGSGIMNLMAYFSAQLADYAIFYYPWKLLIGVILAVFLISLVVPVVVYKTVSRESVVERLRAIE